MSSDSTPASQLNATVAFDVVGTELTVTVTNLTADPAAFNMSAVYWTTTDDVTDLTFTGGPGGCVGGPGPCRWDFFGSTGLGGNTQADGLGVYDWALVSNHTNPGTGIIAPGVSKDFTFDISGTGPFDMFDFASELAEAMPPGSTPGVAAAKFIQCSGSGCVQSDDSAFGATVPEPGTAALVLLGLAGLAIMGRDRP